MVYAVSEEKALAALLAIMAEANFEGWPAWQLTPKCTTTACRAPEFFLVVALAKTNAAEALAPRRFCVVGLDVRCKRRCASWSIELSAQT